MMIQKFKEINSAHQGLKNNHQSYSSYLSDSINFQINYGPLAAWLIF